MRFEQTSDFKRPLIARRQSTKWRGRTLQMEARLTHALFKVPSLWNMAYMEVLRGRILPTLGTQSASPPLYGTFHCASQRREAAFKLCTPSRNDLFFKAGRRKQQKNITNDSVGVRQAHSPSSWVNICDFWPNTVVWRERKESLTRFHHLQQVSHRDSQGLPIWLPSKRNLVCKWHSCLCVCVYFYNSVHRYFQWWSTRGLLQSKPDLS